MKSYPYIGKGIKSGSTALIYEQSKCVAIESKTWAVADLELCDGINEDYFKNITAEFLANTYGEVKSKEHAEFIVKLAETNGIQVSVNCRDGNAKVFSFRTKSGVPRLVLLSTKDHLYNAVSRKQITIPLPPECESVDDKKPLKVLSSGRVYTFNEVTGRYDYGNAALGFITSKDIEKLKEADDYEVISFFGDDASLDDEWPKVNDDVFYNGQKWTFVAKHNDMAMLFWTGDEYCTAKISELQKPKTPEQELRDELISEFREIGQSGIFLLGMYDKVVDEFLSKYNVNKKPQ